MKKAILQLAVLVALFFGTWFALGKVNWISIFQIKENTVSLEKKLGELIWKSYSQGEKEEHNPAVYDPIQQLVRRICRDNGIDSDKIQLHVFIKDEINAFTLPDNHIVVFTGLVAASNNEAELAGVLGHEMAHMEKNHVMKKMIKEVGLSVLISVTAGKGGETIKQLAKMASSSAYDRDLEKEADITSVDYMLKADINPTPLADFLYRLGEDAKLPSQVEWISTHPDSKDRAKYILEYAKGKHSTPKPIISAVQWDLLIETVSKSGKR